MTRISKRIIGWLLGALATLAVAFGIYFAMPQSTKSVKAETPVTFSSAVIGEGPEGNEGYDWALRFDTQGQTWANYNGLQDAKLWKSIADYTIINGRTITEINNAHPNANPIKLTLAPAGSFSFFRMFVDNDVLTVSEIKSMGILEGWSYNNGVDTYTSPAVTFLRQGDAMVLADSYGGEKFTNAVTIGDAVIKNYANDVNLANYGSDSWVVDINIGKDMGGRYDSMYGGMKSIRDAIYINGKSIEEWNADKIAEDPRFGDPSTYTIFPQNSADPSHKDTFVKPVGLWATTTGFQVTIFKELVADAEEIVVTIGENAFINHGGMMTERVSKIVHTQNVKNASSDVILFTNGLGDGYVTYYLNVNAKTPSGGNYWTTAATSGVVHADAGTCLNVFDPQNAGGGQSVLKYIYFNGTSLWDINKAVNGAFGATGAITNGGAWAPILAQLNNYNGGSIIFQIPVRFAGLDENGNAIDSGEGYTNGNATSVANHHTIELKQGLSFYDSTTGYSTYFANDVVFTNETDGGVTQNQRWSKSVTPTEIETTVSVTQKFHGGGFLSFQLSNNDYPTTQTHFSNDGGAEAALKNSNLYDKIKINGTALRGTRIGEVFFHLGGAAANTIALRIGLIQDDSNYTTGDVTNWSGANGAGTTVVIEKGAQFPCYDYITKGGEIRYYVTTEDMTFVYDAATDDFVLKTEEPEAEEHDITEELTFYKQGQQAAGTDTYIVYVDGNYWTCTPHTSGTSTLNEYDYQGSSPVGGQEQMTYILFNGTSLYDINKGDDNTYGSSQSAITNGNGQYAPIMTYMGLDGSRSFIQIHVPTLYGGEGTTSAENHKSITFKEGLSFTYGSTTYTVTRDITWYNQGDDTWSTEVPKTTHDITGELDLRKQTTDKGTEQYILHVGGSYWTAAPKGGCLNEYDYLSSTPVGGQIQMQYILFNGTSLYEINKNDDGAYGSTQGNIAGGGQYAPILVTMGLDIYGTEEDTSDDRSYIMFYVPTLYAGVGNEAGATALENHKSFTFKKGLSFTYGDTIYTVTEDVTFYQHADGKWSTEEPEEPGEEKTENTTVTGIYTQTNENFIVIKLSNNDYAGINQVAINDLSGLYGYIDIGGKVLEDRPSEPYFNVWNIQNSVAFRAPGLNAAQLQEVRYITIKAGAKFPSATTANKFYVTTEDVTIYQVSPAEWMLSEKVIFEDDVKISNPVKSGDVYKVDITFNGITFARGNDVWDLNYFSDDRKIVRQNIFINGKSLFEINTTVDDSGYNYTQSPMTHRDDKTGEILQQEGHDVFVNPTLVYVENGSNVLTVWIFQDYLDAQFENGDVTITVGKGFAYGGKTAIGSVSYSLLSKVTIEPVEDLEGLEVEEYTVIKGTSLASLLLTPHKPVSGNTIYTFSHWENVETGEKCEKVDGDRMVLRAVFTEETVEAELIETEILSIDYYTRGYNNQEGTYFSNNWLVFYLSDSDYEGSTVGLWTGDDNKEKEYLKEIGLLDNVILYGTISVGGKTYNSMTLYEFWTRYGVMDGPYLNIWGNTDAFAIRFGVNDDYTNPTTKIDSIVISAGTSFPSYRHVKNGGTEYRYIITEPVHFNSVRKFEDKTSFADRAGTVVAPEMAVGASVRIKSDLDRSGIRFQTNISKDIVAELEWKMASGWYDSVSYGTIIVPTDYLMGGQFTHAWLTANYGDSTLLGGNGFIDIESSGWYRPNTDDWNVPYTFYGSIVKLNENNYTRKFSGRGYIKLTKGEEVIYIYADYNPAEARSAEYVAHAAINDLSKTYDKVYYPNAMNGYYSPYTAEQHDLLGSYIKNEVDKVLNKQVALAKGINENSTALNKDDRRDITFANSVVINEELKGPYVTLNYSTKVDVWGQFVYRSASNASATPVKEEFYLPANSSQHRQYLDIYRYNGVGYGLSANDLYLVEIGFASTEATTEEFKLISYASGMGDWEKYFAKNQMQVYLTRDDVTANGFGSTSITIGANLGLGGSFTYLARSGIYEGVKRSGISNKNATIHLQTSTSGFLTSSYGNNAPYYGHATSSKAEDNAVNLINNYDAGRQIQQSWYANVGGTTESTNGENGYLRGWCFTDEVEGRYWPYNPVQAGDFISNPSQIVDFEVTGKYIYVKCRAMDWAKGTRVGHEDEYPEGYNFHEGGVTTRSYMENYYYINDDGTVTVTNSYIDWNGFSGMDDIDTQSIELPAVYPVHTLHTYVSDTDGNAGSLESFAHLGNWVSSGLSQQKGNDGLATSNGGYSYTSGNTTVDDKLRGKKSTDWFAWTNGGDIAFGFYIPNVSQFTSGRTPDVIHGSTSVNKQWGTNTGNLSNPYGNSLLNAQLSVLTAEGDLKNMTNMYNNGLQYTSAYVAASSYTAPGINNKMREYVQIEYSYVVCVDTLDNVKAKFTDEKFVKTVDNSGLDKWYRSDKAWTW